MSQDDSQPPERSSAPRLSRDTLLLLGALAFLILAVALTFLFTPNTSNQAGQASPTALGGETSAAGGTPVAQATGGAYPSPSAEAAGDVPTAEPTGGSYPGPQGSLATPTGGEPGSVPTGDPNAEPSPSSAVSAAGQPSETVLALDTATAGSDAYPQPDGTPPTQPTFSPSVTQATQAVAQPTQAPPPPPAQPSVTQPQPTDPPQPQPTDPPQPTPPDQPTSGAESGPKEPPAIPTPAAALPPAVPVDVLRGNVRWSAGQSPIILRRDVQLAPGAELIIEPGVEVRIDPGVSIYVDGARLLALGLVDKPVRFVGNTGARWSGIFGRPGSFIVLENSEVRGGGAGGTVIAVDGGSLVVRSSKVNDNGGAILLTDTRLELKDSEISGNDMPYGAALDASYSRGTTVVMQNNRIGGNILSEGAPMVRVVNQSTFSSLSLDIQGNLFRGGTPNLQLSTNGPLEGGVTCNAMVGDGLGFGLRTQTPQVAPNGALPLALRVENNFMDEHIPPVIPVYLKYGLGRGATSEVLLEMRNNWWGEASGPYEPDANPEGRGDSVGSNIRFAPWLTQPPPCAPQR